MGAWIENTKDGIAATIETVCFAVAVDATYPQGATGFNPEPLCFISPICLLRWILALPN